MYRLACRQLVFAYAYHPGGPYPRLELRNQFHKASTQICGLVDYARHSSKRRRCIGSDPGEARSPMAWLSVLIDRVLRARCTKHTGLPCSRLGSRHGWRTRLDLKLSPAEHSSSPWLASARVGIRTSLRVDCWLSSRQSLAGSSRGAGLTMNRVQQFDAYGAGQSLLTTRSSEGGGIPLSTDNMPKRSYKSLGSPSISSAKSAKRPFLVITERISYLSSSNHISNNSNSMSGGYTTGKYASERAVSESQRNSQSQVGLPSFLASTYTNRWR